MSDSANACKLCGKERLSWQVFCGAACSARYEMGEGREPLSWPKPGDVVDYHAVLGGPVTTAGLAVLARQLS